MKTKNSIFLLIFLLGLGTMLSPSEGLAQASSVDFAIAINGSGSISSADFAIQKEGIKAALNNSLIFPRNGSIGFTLVQYGSSITRLHVPYTVINTQADVDAINATIDGVTQIFGGTNPGDGIAQAMSELNSNGDPSNTQIICLSTDGTPNSGQSVPAALDNARNTGLMLDQFSVIAIEDPPFALEDDFIDVYGSLVFGGGAVTVVDNFIEYANILEATCFFAELELIGIEVNQAVQDWENSVTLVEGKNTIVRVFIQSKDENVIPTIARLRGSRGGVELPGSPLTAQNAGNFLALPQTSDEDQLNSRRNQLDSSLNFLLPETWLNGTIELTVEGAGGLECRETSGTDNDCITTATFEEGAEMEVKFFNISWTDAINNVQTSTNADLNQLENNLIDIFPIQGLDRTTGNFNFGTVSSAPTLNQVNAELEALRFWDLCWPMLGCERLYYGNLPSVIGTTPGLANGVPGTVASGTLDGGNNPYVHAEKLSHTLGVRRVPFCGASDPLAPSFPYTALIDGETKATIGPLDLGIQETIYGLLPRTDQVLNPRTQFELLSCCRPSWISKFTYENVFAAIENTFGSTSTPASPIGTMEYQVFRGLINVDAGTTAFAPTSLLISDFEPPVPSSGEYNLELLDENDNVIESIAFAPTLYYKDENKDTSIPQAGSFIIPVLANSAVKSAKVTKDGDDIGSIDASDNAPTVEITFPNGGENLSDETVLLAWDAEDLDGDDLSFVVQFSPDGGSTWTTFATQWTETTYPVALRDLAQTSTGLIRVIASDGFNTAQDVSDGTFITPNNAPVISILRPQNNQVFIGVQQVFCEARADDVEDGRLSGSQLRWTSDRDGFLGTGERINFPASDLSEGPHVFTCQATDNLGAVEVASITCTILRVAPTVCAFTRVEIVGGPACNQSDGTFSQDITFFYDNPPSTGELEVNGQLFLLGNSPQTVTLTGLIPDGNPFSLLARFTADTACKVEADNLFISPVTCVDDTSGPEVSEFILVDAQADVDLQVIQDGDVINVFDFDNQFFAFRVQETNENSVESMKLIMEGPISRYLVDNEAPYTYFQLIGNDFNGKILPPGDYTLSAVPYSEDNKGGEQGDTLRVSFTVETNSAVSSFTLLNADTDTEIGPLADGDTLNLLELGNISFAIQANTQPAEVGSVYLEISGPVNKTRLEHEAVYTIFGDNGSNYFGKKLSPGTYTLSATPYSATYRRGGIGMAQTIQFTVIDGVSTPAVNIFPNPTDDMITIDYQSLISEPTHVIIIDAFGNVVMQKTYDGNSPLSLNLSQLNTGVYTVKLLNSKETISQTISVH